MLSIIIGNLVIAGIVSYPAALISSTIYNIDRTARTGRLNFSRCSGRFVEHYANISITLFISLNIMCAIYYTFN